jgi:hypothetical protein
MSDVTMQDLELEHAELLPARETLHSGFRFTQVGYGNTAQLGLFNFAVGNGSLDNLGSVFSGTV